MTKTLPNPKRQSFLLKTRLKKDFDLLTDVEAGKLIKAIFAYEETGEFSKLPRILSFLLRTISYDLDNDKDRYSAKVEANRANGLKGGRPRNKPKKPTGLTGLKNKPKKANNNNSINNSINNNINNNNLERKKKSLTLKEKKFSKIEDVTESVMQELASRYDLPMGTIRRKLEAVRLYEEANNKNYKNYKAVLNLWLLRDIEKLSSSQKNYANRKTAYYKPE